MAILCFQKAYFYILNRFISVVIAKILDLKSFFFFLDFQKKNPGDFVGTITMNGSNINYWDTPLWNLNTWVYNL